jgi:hypothetical protein
LTHEVRFKLDTSANGGGTSNYDGVYTVIFTFADGNVVEYSFESQQGGNNDDDDDD